MKAILYARVTKYGTDEDKTLLQSQVNEIREYAEKNSIEIIKEYLDDGVSAYGTNFFERPHGKEILRLIASNQVDCIIVTGTERLF